ncbi:MAG: LemA family protein [Rhodothermales bacterium]|nr:LemA family protein [Rhodothermales bacterium]
MRSKGTITLVIIVLLVAFAGCAGCGTYNGLVSLDEGVERSWADVESQYQRRADLIPNLVNTVRGAADFEQETLESVTSARARATSINITADDLGNPEKMQQYMAAQQQLGQSLGRLLAVAENYPQLRATEAFRDLQAQLEGTENRINVARRDYNGSVQGYNTAVRRFPANMIAGMFGFDRRTPFEADEGADRAPEVNFDS